jgi:hypothetical protein
MAINYQEFFIPLNIKLSRISSMNLMKVLGSMLIVMKNFCDEYLLRMEVEAELLNFQI